MPSSPTFRPFTRQPRRFVHRGISLLPQDMLAEGKVSLLQNMRSWEEGTLTVRNGLIRRSAASLGSDVHSLFRLNDPALLAGGDPAIRVAGAGAHLFSGVPSDASSLSATDGYAQIDTGYSGDPLTAVAAAPALSPQPWLYVADRDRMRKVDASNTVRTIGLPPPALPPVARLAASQTTFLESIDGGNWVPFGGQADAVSAGPTTRLATVVNAVIYDEGALGMCSVTLADPAGVTEGATIALGPSGETVIVQEVIPAISPTTIEAILYDVGVSGFCTIQPAGSFALGQTEVAFPDEIRRRYYKVDGEARPRVTVTRAVDFPVNALITINGLELVRILSVAVGPDGVMSFRAFTALTHAAGDTLDGHTCFRAHTQTTISGGDPAEAPAAKNAITPVDATTPAFAGIQVGIGPERDWSQVGDRAMQPDDMIGLGIKVSDLAFVEFVRLMLATNTGGVPAGEEFSRNYYQYEWRANDLLAALQASLAAASAEGVDSMLAAQTRAVVSGQTETFYEQGYGTEPLALGPPPIGSIGDTPVVGGANNDPIAFSGDPQVRTDGFVTAGTAPSRQLALGNNQWITLQCRVRDLLRVGTDPDRTLANLNAAAIVLQVTGTDQPVTVWYADPYLTGGYGPDCGVTRAPYVWRYRYRSTITGERGNPSPAMRAGIPARRQRVSLTVLGCTQPQCDVVDIFRFGGSLARWTYARSVANDVTGAAINCDDDMADRQIDGGESMDVTLFQPWPVADLPRSGTCRVVGTSVVWISGDVFNPLWSPDTPILVNGRATALYGSPLSTTRLDVIDNCDAGDPVEFSIPAPILMAQPLPRLWGGAVDGAWFHFGCGDPSDPGAVHWTRGNDPDASSDANVLVVSSASEPLLNGCVVDGAAFVFSTDDLYRLIPTFGSLSAFAAQKTACSRGLWNPWAFCVGDEGIYFVAKDGIFLTQWGSAEVSIVDPDLRVLFPSDGSFAGDPNRCLSPIDMTAPMKLTRVDQMIYFDYYDTSGDGRTLVYEPLYRRWTPDVYLGGDAGVTARLNEPGDQVHDQVVGGDNGQVYQVSSLTLLDDIDPIHWLCSTPWEVGGDLRALKHWGDVVLDLNAAGSFDGVRVEPVVDQGATGLVATTGVGRNTWGRQTFVVEVGAVAGDVGKGVLSQNFGLLLSGVTQLNDRARPQLYFWEPAWIPKAEIIARRATDWEDLGYKGAKFVQGVVIRADTFGVAKTVAVDYDGTGLGLTLTLNHDGETTKTYPLEAAGWTPFVAELVRLRGADAVDWILLDWRFVWEPAPELATQYETQETTFDFPGYGSVADAVLAYQSTTETTLRVYHDAGFVDYIIPSSAGVYTRAHVWFQAKKGLRYKFRWTGAAPFRVYQRDTAVRAQAWNNPGGWTTVQPFGGPSRAVGAEV